MSKEQFESLLMKVAELRAEIERIPNSTANGQLIDAASHTRCIENHLKRYFAMTGEKQ